MCAEPFSIDLKLRLAGLVPSAVRFQQTVYRSTAPKYATETDLPTGIGSQRFGGRWNPQGIAAVYASLTPETAMAEALAHVRYYGFPIDEALPRTFVAIEAHLQIVLDCRSDDVRQSLAASLEALQTVDWRKEVAEGREPLTRQVGRMAYEAGLEGLVDPSAADPHGMNLLVFPANLRPESGLRVLHADRLSH